MAILSDARIIEYIVDKKIKIKPFIYKNVQPASVDLTLDNLIKIPIKTDETIKTFKSIEKHFDVRKLDEYVIGPGEYILAQIKEEIGIPNDIHANVQNRNSLIRMGIDVGLSSYINPGYEGQLPIVIKNIGTFKVQLTPGMRICQMIFHDVKPPSVIDYSQRSSSKYHKEKGTLVSKIHLDDEINDFMKEFGIRDRNKIDHKKLSSYLEENFKNEQDLTEQLSEEDKKRFGL